MVQCIFIDISTADGCHVTFTDSSQGINESFNITKPNSIESIIWKYITVSVSGNYTVIGYDIVNGIIVDTPSIVYHNVIQYISIQLTPLVSTTFAITNALSTITDDHDDSIMINTCISIIPFSKIEQHSLISTLSDIVISQSITIIPTSSSGNIH